MVDRSTRYPVQGKPGYPCHHPALDPGRADLDPKDPPLMPVQCEVPGCDNPRMDEDADTCKNPHSYKHHTPGCLPNDGIIDWTAIELATGGARLPRLTWLERDIAAAILFASGFNFAEVSRRVDINLHRPRLERVMEMAKAIKAGAPVGH